MGFNAVYGKRGYHKLNFVVDNVLTVIEHWKAYFLAVPVALYGSMFLVVGNLKY